MNYFHAVGNHVIENHVNQGITVLILPCCTNAISNHILKEEHQNLKINVCSTNYIYFKINYDFLNDFGNSQFLKFCSHICCNKNIDFFFVLQSNVSFYV